MPQTMCTTIVHFLVFLKRFSPRHRASARCCSRLAKRRQLPSRRSRCILQHMEFIICKQILLKIGGPAARHIGVHWCLFVVPYQSFWLRLGRSMFFAAIVSKTDCALRNRSHWSATLPHRHNIFMANTLLPCFMPETAGQDRRRSAGSRCTCRPSGHWPLSMSITTICVFLSLR